MIGVLAYGSLITTPGSELAAVTVGKTEGVLTPFSVEFARKSSGRCGAPTLVPVDAGGSSVRAVIFRVNVGPNEAIDIVYRREINAVGGDKVYKEPPAHRINAVRIARIEGLAGFDSVLYTRIIANIFPLSADILANLAIDSARVLDDGRDGITYLMDAKSCGIKTPLSAAYERSILKKTGSVDLAAALASIRERNRSY